MTYRRCDFGDWLPPREDDPRRCTKEARFAIPVSGGEGGDYLYLCAEHYDRVLADMTPETKAKLGGRR